MSIQKQLSVFVENKIGSIYDLCSILSRENINILGLLVSDDHDWGIVRLVVDNVQKAKDLLEDQRYVLGENDVITTSFNNIPGEIAVLAEKLRKANISIEYTYATGGGEKMLLILSTSNNREADGLLKGD